MFFEEFFNKPIGFKLLKWECYNMNENKQILHSLSPIIT